MDTQKSNNINKMWIHGCYIDNLPVSGEKIYSMLFQSKKLLLQSESFQRVQYGRFCMSIKLAVILC